MADGHLNHCKECVKNRVINHRTRNIEGIRAYDRERGKTEKRLKLSVYFSKKHRKEKPGYCAAHSTLERAIKKGIIKKPKLCPECGSNRKIEAHHHDYTKPLEVIWLCCACHRILHQGKTEKAESLRGKYKVPTI